MQTAAPAMMNVQIADISGPEHLCSPNLFSHVRYSTWWVQAMLAQTRGKKLRFADTLLDTRRS